jgi:hypothetical protein
MLIRRSALAAAGVAACLLLGLAAAGAHALPRCHRRFPDRIPVYARLVIASARHHLSCSQAARVGNAVATRYERGLPTADYPPPPKGVPGGQGHRFHVASALGRFTCRMTARGSDFVVAVCRRGARSARVESINDYYLRHRNRPSGGDATGTRATRACLPNDGRDAIFIRRDGGRMWMRYLAAP